MNAAGPPCQDEHRRLEGILGIVHIMQHAPANAEHQAGMAPQQQLERRFIAGCDKTLQQLSIADAAHLRRRSADALQQHG